MGTIQLGSKSARYFYGRGGNGVATTCTCRVDVLFEPSAWRFSVAAELVLFCERCRVCREWNALLGAQRCTATHSSRLSMCPDSFPSDLLRLVALMDEPREHVAVVDGEVVALAVDVGRDDRCEVAPVLILWTHGGGGKNKGGMWCRRGQNCGMSAARFHVGLNQDATERSPRANRGKLLPCYLLRWCERGQSETPDVGDALGRNLSDLPLLYWTHSNLSRCIWSEF